MEPKHFLKLYNGQEPGLEFYGRNLYEQTFLRETFDSEWLAFIVLRDHMGNISDYTPWPKLGKRYRILDMMLPIKFCHIGQISHFIIKKRRLVLLDSNAGLCSHL